MSSQLHTQVLELHGENSAPRSFYPLEQQILLHLDDVLQGPLILKRQL